MRVAPVEQIVHVFKDVDLVAPLSLTTTNDSAPAATNWPARVQIERETGETFDAPVYRFAAKVRDTASWLAPLLDWSASSPDAPTAQTDAPALQFAAVVIPASQTPHTDERWMRIAGQRVAVQVWSPLGVTNASSPSTTRKMPEGLRTRIEPLRHDPAQAWRAALLQSRLAGDPITIRPFTADFNPSAWASAPVACLVTQTTLRWWRALSVLADIDGDLAVAVRFALTRTITFPAGVTVPAWGADPSAESHLLEELLSPALDDDAKQARARVWLEAQPAGFAWVIDDAAGITSRIGRMAPTPTPAIGVANLTNHSQRAVVGMASAPAATKRSVLAPASATITAWPKGSRAAPGPASATNLQVSVGDWRSSVTAQGRAIAAQPPGVRGQRLHGPHTMRSWLTATEPAPNAASATSVLVQRQTGAGDWEVYVECDRPSRTSEDADVVRVFFGPRDAPLAVLRIEPDGTITDEITDASQNDIDALGPPRGLDKTAHGGDATRWWALAPIPRWAIEPGNVVRIGVERRAMGARATWPRPMLPWDDSPGRALIDLTKWSPLGGP